MLKQDGNRGAIIRLFHVHRAYGAKHALVDVSLEIDRNELIFISGPSGAGKTTLLKLLYLGEPVTSGQILVEGINLSRISRRKIPWLRRKFGIIFQDYKLIANKTVFENVALVMEAAGRRHRLVQKKVNHVLRMVGMEERKLALPPSLSGGEQQRVAVARAIVGEPKIILADEPTGSLDAEAAKAILGLLKQYHACHRTVIIASHDRELIRRTGGRVVHLKDGRLVATQRK